MTPLAMPISDANRLGKDRRRRARLQSRTQGWVTASNRTRVPYLPAEDDGQEIWVENLSRLGVGFISAEPMAIGIEQQLRVGRGPMTRCRPVRVIFCRKLDEHVYRVGVEFTAVAGRTLTRPGEPVRDTIAA